MNSNNFIYTKRSKGRVNLYTKDKNENGTPLYNENEKANEAYIVLQGSVEERRMFTQIELISAIDQLKKLMFQFDQLFDNIRNLLSDFTTGYSSQLIVARNKKKQQQKVNAYFKESFSGYLEDVIPNVSTLESRHHIETTQRP